METNEALLQHMLKTLEERLKGYESILAKQKYLAGDVRLKLILLIFLVAYCVFNSCLLSQISSIFRTELLSLNLPALPH